MDLKKLKATELAKLLLPSSEAFLELRERGVLKTKNLVGELGQYYAGDFYYNHSKLPNLFSAPLGVQNVDALSRNGELYSIKTVSSRGGTTGSFLGPDSINKNEQKFHYLLIVILDDAYALDMILELTWDDFIKHKKFNSRMNNYNITATKKLINLVKIVYEKQ